MKLLKQIWQAIVKSTKTTPTPRQDNDGNPVLVKPEVPAKQPNGKFDFIGASKLRYPLAVAFELDNTSANSTINPVFVVLHHTVTYDLNSTVKYFQKANVSVHYVVGHDGQIVQMAENNKKCWHAGESSYAGYTGLNSYSVGIEVVNMGPLKKKGDKFYDYYDREYKGPVNVRKGLGYEYWEAIKPAQEQAVIKLCVYLSQVLNIPVKNFVGHYEIAPKRKNDPYGLFTFGDMSAFRKELGQHL